MLYKIILLTIGTLTFLIGIVFSAIFPPASIIFGIVAAYCFLRAVFWPLAESIVGGVFSPARKNKTAPFLFDKISSMIAKQDYEQALFELESILAKDNTNYTATSMAASLYAKKLNEPQKGLSCIKKYLEKKTTRSADDADMVLMFSDICLANNMHALAIETIEAELSRKYSAADKRSLTLRLETLKKNNIY